MVTLLAGNARGGHTEFDVSVILPPRQVHGAKPYLSGGSGWRSGSTSLATR